MIKLCMEDESFVTEGYSRHHARPDIQPRRKNNLNGTVDIQHRAKGFLSEN